MNRRLGRGKAVLGAIVREVRAENLPFLAGSIAYHAFVSLIPLLFLVLFAISRVGTEQLAQAVVQDLVTYLVPTVANREQEVSLLVRVAQRAARDPQVSVVGGLALGWAVLKIFRGLDTAFSDIYESEAANTVPDQLGDAVVVFGGITLAVAAVSYADSFVDPGGLGAWRVVAVPLATMAGISIALLPMYYVFPDEDVTLREVVPGTVVAAGGWALLSQLFKLYVGLSSKTAMYGLVGTVLVLITWLYFSGLVLLVGAAVNAVLAGRSADVANIAWGEPLDADPTAGDAPFASQLDELDGAFSGATTVRVETGDTEVELPPPDDASVVVQAIDRPDVLGGDRETAELRLRWDSWKED